MNIKVVLVTAPSKNAPDLARQMVEKRLCACANIIPGVRSIYHWQGAIHDDSESLIIFKTSIERLAELESAVLTAHPYETPEFVTLAPEQVTPKYLDWLKSTLDTTS